MDDITEFGRLEALRPLLAGDGPGIPVGVGDDAAVVATPEGAVVACVDALVEDVHFRLDLSSPADVGWKAIAVNISDLAAMGARPRAALVVLQRRPDLAERDIAAVYQGMAEAAARWGMPVVGGDTVTAPVWSISVTALGAPGARTVRRDGARPGDRVVLAGRLGAAAAALWAVGEGLAVPDALLAAHRRPVALAATGVALAAAGASAMIDVSDGIGADARHVAADSGVALHLDAHALRDMAAPGVAALLPPDVLDEVVLGGGEDFALLATVPAAAVPAVEAALRTVREGGGQTGGAPEEVPWAWIGEVRPGRGEVWLVEASGREARIDHLGFDHG